MTVTIPTALVPTCASVLASNAWLRDDARADERVLAHLAAENAATDQALAPLAALQGELRAAFGRVQEVAHTGPRIPDGEWEYWSHLPAGADYSQSWRSRRGSGVDELVLDPTALADGGQFSLGEVQITDDHRLLLWLEDRSGDEQYTMAVKEIGSQEVLFTLEDTIAGPLAGDAAFDAAGEHVWVVALDEASRPTSVVRVRLSDGAQQVVFTEADGRFWVSLGETADLSKVCVVSSSTTTSEVWLLDRHHALSPARLVAARQAGTRYSIDSLTGHPLASADGLVALVAIGDGEYYLAQPRMGEPTWRWPALWTPPAGVILEDASLRTDHVVVDIREGGWARVGVLHCHDGKVAFERVELGVNGAVTVASIDMPEPGHPELWVNVDGYSTAEVTRARPLCGGSWRHVHTAELPAGVELDDYHSGVFEVVSFDGTVIPVSWFARRDVPVRGVQLYGYGAYGLADDPGFTASWTAIADRGVVCAVAHIRGGCEFGRAWHRAGRMENKENSFQDFLACARAVKAQFGTDRVVIRGGSAGGLLVGATVNLAPSEFAGVVAEVPFVDCLATMQDPTLPLVITDYEEWGNPADPAVAERIRAYTPVENVRAEAYPPILATCGLNDPRVSYWEPAKWVQVLRARATDGPFLLRTTDAGHAGASSISSALDERAEAAAFVIAAIDGLL